MTISSERFGDYRVKEPLSSGPLADVFRAIEEPSGREVAIKTLRPMIAKGSPYATRLAREARILARLHHQGLPLLYAVHETETSFFLALEYIDGFSLEHVLSKASRLSQNAALAIGIELAQALSHAHQRGIVHQRLVPSNVLVSRRGEIKLIDFGSALDETAPALSRGLEVEASFGDASSMAPEQILGEPVDARADVFALGALLYQLLVGHRPFEGPDARTTAHRVRHEPVPPLRAKLPEISRTAERIVLRCLEKNPDDRFASAAEVSAALETALRALVTTPRHQLILAELGRIRLLGDVELSNASLTKTAIVRELSPKGSLFISTIAHFVLLALLLGGGALIQLRAKKTNDTNQVGGHGPLELSPKSAGSLHIVATPWAHVVINGQEVETTPFARPIPLPPGTHYVTLRHPNAQDERRVIRITPGQSVKLEVRMGVTP